MKQKFYFIDGTFYSPRNKAHEEISAYAAQFDHVVMDDARLKEFIQEAKQKAEEVNANHKRCKDFTLTHFESKLTSCESQSLYVEGTFSLNITLVKRFEN